MKTRNGGIVDNGDYLLFYWGRMKTEKLANALTSLLLTHPTMNEKRVGVGQSISSAIFSSVLYYSLVVKRGARGVGGGGVERTRQREIREQQQMPVITKQPATNLLEVCFYFLFNSNLFYFSKLFPYS